MKKVVAIGGGTGLSTLLRGLRSYPIDLTAIVAMTDDGASSGRLRKSNGVLPPGDVRKCIAALSENETGLTELFEYRYKNGLGLRGHSVGNLMIAAMMEKTGSFELAVEQISSMLNIRGCVLPSTLEDVQLQAEFDNGTVVIGEEKLSKYGHKHKIKKLSLFGTTKTNIHAVKAIENADVIFIGPGSLYSSIISNFLHPKLLTAVKASNALKVYICNVSTEKGETENFSVEDHLKILEQYSISYDAVLINSSVPKIPDDSLISPLLLNENIDIDKILIKSDIVDAKHPLYHNPDKLGQKCYQIVVDSGKILRKKYSRKFYEI